MPVSWREDSMPGNRQLKWIVTCWTKEAALKNSADIVPSVQDRCWRWNAAWCNEKEVLVLSSYVSKRLSAFPHYPLKCKLVAHQWSHVLESIEMFIYEVRKLPRHESRLLLGGLSHMAALRFHTFPRSFSNGGVEHSSVNEANVPAATQRERKTKIKAPGPTQYVTEHRIGFLVFNTLFGLTQFNSPTVT